MTLAVDGRQCNDKVGILGLAERNGSCPVQARLTRLLNIITQPNTKIAAPGKNKGVLVNFLMMKPSRSKAVANSLTFRVYKI